LLPLPDSGAYGQVVAANAPPQGSAQLQFNTLVTGLVNNVKYIIGAVAIIMAIYAGFRMVTAGGDEAVYTKERATLIWSIIGLAIVGLAGEMGKILQVGCDPSSTTPCVEGGFLKDPNAIIRASTLFNTRTQIVIVFIKYFVGSIAVIMIVRNGLRMITMGSTDDKLAQDKKNLTYSAIGLILIILADNVISNVFYKIDLTRYPSVGGAAPAVDATRGVSELVGITNAIVTFVGPLAILAMIIAGIMYITAAGKDEQINKAKKLMFASLLGIIIIYGAFAIVSTFISGSFGEPASTQQIQNAASGGQTQEAAVPGQ
jgi:cytochrome bd-type quinol oxidase subunit 2